MGRSLFLSKYDLRFGLVWDGWAFFSLFWYWNCNPKWLKPKTLFVAKYIPLRLFLEDFCKQKSYIHQISEKHERKPVRFFEKKKFRHRYRNWILVLVPNSKTGSWSFGNKLVLKLCMWNYSKKCPVLLTVVLVSGISKQQ